MKTNPHQRDRVISQIATGEISPEIVALGRKVHSLGLSSSRPPVGWLLMADMTFIRIDEHEAFSQVSDVHAIHQGKAPFVYTTIEMRKTVIPSALRLVHGIATRRDESIRTKANRYTVWKRRSET
jgi:hypothetical protein